MKLFSEGNKKKTTKKSEGSLRDLLDTIRQINILIITQEKNKSDWKLHKYREGGRHPDSRSPVKPARNNPKHSIPNNEKNFWSNKSKLRFKYKSSLIIDYKWTAEMYMSEGREQDRIRSKCWKKSTAYPAYCIWQIHVAKIKNRLTLSGGGDFPEVTKSEGVYIEASLDFFTYNDKENPSCWSQ